MAGFDPRATYLHLADDLSAATVPVDGAFWETISERTELHDGRLMTVIAMTETWTTWERHPNGDEVVMLLSGAMTMVLDEPGGERRVALAGGQLVIVPRGVWHRGIVHDAGEALFITPGKGTEHRPV